MKETKMIKIPEYEYERVTYICDICGKRVDDTSYGAMKKCRICGDDICSDCAIITNSEYLENGSFIGDYPEYYCPKCWKAGKEIRKQILKLRKIQEEEEDKLWGQWHKLCPSSKGGE